MQTLTRNVGIVLFAVLPLALFGQTTDTATIRGQVTDSSQAALAASTVTALNTQTGALRTTVTDAGGNYVLPGLPIAGSYTLTAEHQGFAAHSVPNLTLSGGMTAKIDLTLGVAGTSTTVNVTGVVGEVHADQPQLGDRLGPQQIRNTPLLGNQITALPLLNSANRPAINMGDTFTNQVLITTGGQGRRQTSFSIDGANANDNWGRQTIFTAVPPEAVQEMTVLENPFSASYGATTGGVVNLVTKSGAQQWHGMGQYAFRPNGTAAALDGFSGSTSAHPTNDHFNQGDWLLSGPMGAHTEFAVAGEATSRYRDSPITSPLAPGVFRGQYGAGLLFARVDHQFSPNESVFFRADADTFYDTNPNGSVGGNTLPTTDRIFKRRTYSGVLGFSSVLSPTVVNALRLQFQLASPITEFDPVNDSTAFSVPIAGSQTFTSGTSQSALLLNRQYEVGDTVSATWGLHTIEFGADVVTSRDGGDSKEFGGPMFLGQFNFATCSNTVTYCESAAYLGNIGNVTSFTQSFGTGNYAVKDTLTSVFVQDNFHATPNLTLNLGARYERQSFTQARKNFAPRLGFAYSPRPRTAVRGGYGIFYSPIHDNVDADFTLSGPTGVFNFTATPGQPGFPATLAPWPSFPSGASVPRESLILQPGRASYYDQFLPTSVLEGYPNALLNPYSEQWSLGLEQGFGRTWTVSADYIGNHTMRIDRELDIDAPPAFIRTAQNQWRGVTNEADGSLTCNATGQAKLSAAQASSCAAAAANAARPLWVYDAAHGITPAYDVVEAELNDGDSWYDALEVNLNHTFSHHLQMLASYTWSHALDTVDADATAQSPNNPTVTGNEEKGNTLWNQPQRFVLSGSYTAPFRISVGGIATLGSGLQYNLSTGTANGGDTRQETDRPVVNGVVLARNSGRGNAIYHFDPFIERPFQIGERMQLRVRAESFNVFNHPNFVSYNGTYGNGGTAPAGLGSPSFGLSSQLTPREFQFSLALSF
ncbi:MAG: TonB-dependent receptor [Terriglobales bacterium]